MMNRHESRKDSIVEYPLDHVSDLTPRSTNSGGTSSPKDKRRSNSSDIQKNASGVPSSLSNEIASDGCVRSIETLSSGNSMNDKSNRAKSRECSRSRVLIRSVGTSLFTTTLFISLGAVMFSAIELPREKEDILELKHFLEHRAALFTDQLVNHTVVLACAPSGQSECFDNVNRTEMYRMMEEFVNEMLTNVGVDEFRLGTPDSRIIPNWDVPGAFYFCITTVTTIGYGNFTPGSSLGQAMVVVFALFGIPGFLFTLSQISRLNTHISFKIRRRFNIVSKRGRTVYYTVVSVVAFLVLFILPLPWFIIGYDLNFVTSFYFVFVSLSTIGFGDIYPTDPGNARSEEPGYRVLFTVLLYIYMLLGLSLFGNVLQSLQSGVERLSLRFIKCLPASAQEVINPGASNQNGEGEINPEVDRQQAETTEVAKPQTQNTAINVSQTGPIVL